MLPSIDLVSSSTLPSVCVKSNRCLFEGISSSSSSVDALTSNSFSSWDVGDEAISGREGTVKVGDGKNTGESGDVGGELLFTERESG